MSKFIFKSEMSASVKGRTKLKSALSRANQEHKIDTRGFSAICRYIDKLSKQGLLEQKGFKPNAVKSIAQNGAFKTIKPLMNEREQNRDLFTLWTLGLIANRLDKKESKK